VKTRDAEALEFIANSGQFMVRFDGTVLTSRDKHGRPTDPPVWRKATHISTSKQSSPRNRLWVNGKRVYGARAVYRLIYGPIPEGYQVDHKDDNSLNDAPENLQLLDGDGNLQKECAREGTRMKRFEPVYEVPIGGTAPLGSLIIFDGAKQLTEADWDGINRVATAGDVPPIYYDEAPADQKDRRPDFYMCAGEPVDWRISLADDVRVGWKKFRRWLSLRSILAAARRFFDRTFLGFR